MKPWEAVKLRETIERCLGRAAGRRQVSQRAELFDTLTQPEGPPRDEPMVGWSSGLRPVAELVRRAAKADAPVLLLGETGTGKELIAHAIHAASPRANGPLVSVNCGALTESLLESELFGHEAGAFTGAVRARKGRFELASGGTLFLDEIGEVTPRMQVALLRAIQEGRIEPHRHLRSLLHDPQPAGGDGLGPLRVPSDPPRAGRSPHAAAAGVLGAIRRGLPGHPSAWAAVSARLCSSTSTTCPEARHDSRAQPDASTAPAHMRLSICSE